MREIKNGDENEKGERYLRREKRDRIEADDIEK